MTGSARQERVAEAFKEILAAEIPRLKDPRVGFVTVTGVRVSPDLRRAWVYYTALGDEAARKRTAAGLRSALSHLRSELGRGTRLKFTPEIEFEEDQAMAVGERVETIIRELHTDG